MTTPDPGVIIPTAQMYQEVRDLAKAVGRIESKVDSVLDETKDIRSDIADHELRIRTIEHGQSERQRTETSRVDAVEARTTSVERRQWAATGAVGVICTGAGYLMQFLIK